MSRTAVFGVAALLAGCALVSNSYAQMEKSYRTLADVQAAAAKYNSVISVPPLETEPAGLEKSVKDAIAKANTALDRIGALKSSEVNFTNTVRALDDMGYEVMLTANRVGLLRETSTNGALRDTSTEQSKVLDEWSVGTDYREDVYRAVKAYADSNPKLEGEDAKLLSETMRDYRRAGLELPKPQRDEIEALRKQLSAIITDFDANITKAKKEIVFTKAELEGAPEDFLSQVKTGDDQYTVQANVTWQYIAVMDNAKSEATRKKFQAARENLARTENVPLLEQILVLRDTLAKKLGYKNWADYRIEPKMAKNAATALDFEINLTKGLQPKFDRELAEFRTLKIEETGDTNAIINLWDWRYYSNQLKKKKYTVDEEALKVFFPYQKALEGMFSIYQNIFGLKFEQIEPPYKWIGDLQLYAVSDSATGEPVCTSRMNIIHRV